MQTAAKKKSFLSIRGAKEHNLKNISLDIPRNTLTVVTGVSGSGKSSLCYDTIFKEGQRRYIASLSAYARQFMQQIERPSADLIEGLSPAICIDQKTAGSNPRSTAGTVTEIYDFLRLLYARLGQPHCPAGHGPISGQTFEQICDHIMREYQEHIVCVMAPVIIARKGSYRKILKEIQIKGFSRIRIDGELKKLDGNIPLGRYEKHTIEIVIDRLDTVSSNITRLSEAVRKALDITKTIVSVMEYSSKKKETGENYRTYTTMHACPVCGISIPELEPRLFSFNVPQGACPCCSGLGYLQRFHESKFVRDADLPLLEGALSVLNPEGNILYINSGRNEIIRLAKKYGIDISKPFSSLPVKFVNRLFWGTESTSEMKDPEFYFTPDTFSITSSLVYIYRKYNITPLEKYMLRRVCPECRGARLNPVARSVRFDNRVIHELTALQIYTLKEYFSGITLHGNKHHIGTPIIREITDRLDFLLSVGLDYLSLDRPANTLSGGEAQRIRLAAQIGSGLEGCVYILDEPSIGLHQCDNRRLLTMLTRLRDKGNTILVIEHDEETMLCADHLVDIGPGAGVEGGTVCFNGDPSRLPPPTDLLLSRTHTYLCGKEILGIPSVRRQPAGYIEITGIHRHNLKDVTLRLPLGIFTVVAGVSGSGKSTLIFDVFKEYLEKSGQKSNALKGDLVRNDLNENDIDEYSMNNPEPYVHAAENKTAYSVSGGSGGTLSDKITRGGKHKVIEIDQKPIGRTPRSNPATYSKAMDYIRDLFSLLPESRIRGYKKGRFSFNVKGGRCETCGGAGVVTMDMQIFQSTEVVCDACSGKRFNQQTLEIHYRGKNIFDILEMTVHDACVFFKDIPSLSPILNIMEEIGLGYIRLGQPSTSLSGGEAQRVKLASELKKKPDGKTIYLLDEPTTGLHFDDIKKLLKCLNRLTEGGNTVVVIEHNLDMLKAADYIIEMGPGGGGKGGQIIAEGTPEDIALAATPTGTELSRFFQRFYDRKNGKFSGAAGYKKLYTGIRKESGIEDAVPDNSCSSGLIRLHGVKKNNLKNISLDLPKNKIIAVTGVSGSGKTSLAFDTIFQEGQRKYLESLSTYARRFLGRMPRAEADKIEGITPTIAVDQKAHNKNPRSTLATQTEIYDSLRVLFANIGKMHCPVCGKILSTHSPAELTELCPQVHSGKTCTVKAPLFLRSCKKELLLKESKNIIDFIPVLMQKGYSRIEIDGIVQRLDSTISPEQFLRAEKIFLIIDRFIPDKAETSRMLDSFEKAYDSGENLLCIQEENSAKSETYYSRFYACVPHNFFFEDKLSTRHFSFNHHLGACPRCGGIGQARSVSEERLIENPELPLLSGALYKKLSPFFTRRGQFYGSLLKRFARSLNIDIWDTPWKKVPEKIQKSILYGSKKPEDNWKGMSYIIEDLHARSESDRWRDAFSHVMDFIRCPLCHGGRLRPELLAVTINGNSINQITEYTIQKAAEFFTALSGALSTHEKTAMREVLEEINFRLTQMMNLGLHYLSLNRIMGSLSGGEAQRIRLSTQIGNKLGDVIYVLDEPTIGLHSHDTEKLMGAVRLLKERGNTVIMVEHDLSVIRGSDWITDIGPCAGKDGGYLMYNGPFRLNAMQKTSFYPYLKNVDSKNAASSLYREILPYKTAEYTLDLKGITRNNIKNQRVKIPLGRLCGISGVSGSGKSSFIEWLLPRLVNSQKKNDERKYINEIHTVDQTPITGSKRSTAASAIGAFDLIRDMFSHTPDARAKGFAPGHFSFNSALGRCPACSGKGFEDIEMHFISDISVPCDSCKGRRFNRETLSVYFQEKNIADILDLSFQHAMEFFKKFPRITNRLKFLVDAGLGYLSLGIPTSMLSGGELQRLKLGSELAHTGLCRNVYILDEPTTGLHSADVQNLIGILNSLVQRGNTVIAVEHNIDFLKNCDYIIDFGPGAGDAGGTIVASGSPTEITAQQKGFTWKYLYTQE